MSSISYAPRRECTIYSTLQIFTWSLGSLTLISPPESAADRTTYESHPLRLEAIVIQPTLIRRLDQSEQGEREDGIVGNLAHKAEAARGRFTLGCSS